MIDWTMLGINALWIVGLAVALAAVSYTSWEAWSTHESFRSRLGRPPSRAVLALAGALICLGRAGASSEYWLAGIWLVLAALFLWQIWVSLHTTS